MEQISNILEGLAKTIAKKLKNTASLNYSLLGGNFGEILFLYYYSRLNPDYLAIAECQTDRMLAGLNRISPIATYCNGLAGLALGLNELQQDGFMQGVDDAIGAFDDVILEHQQADLMSNRHDFLHGFIGLGFYWLMRYRNSGVGMKALKEIVDYLAASCEVVGDALRWRLPEGKRDKRYNISLSHGISSTIILLSRLSRMSSLPKQMRFEIERLTTGAVNYLNGNRQDPERHGSCFPMTSADCSGPSKSRLAWCYGDLGIALALLQYKFPHKNGLDIFEYSATHRRSLIENSVYDACICHGTAGVGAFFDYFVAHYPLPVFTDASRYGRAETLKKANQDGKFTTFKYMFTLQEQLEDGNGILLGAVKSLQKVIRS